MRIPTTFNKMGLSPSGGDEPYGPTSGLVFYMPLTQNTLEIAGNRTMTVTGTVTPSVVGGVPCMEIPYGSFIQNITEQGELPIGNHSLSMSIWVKCNQTGYDQTMFFYGKQATRANLWIFSSGLNEVVMGSWGGDLGTGIYWDKEWHHYVAVYDQSVSKYRAYKDGVLIKESSISSPNLTWKAIGIGIRDNTTESKFRGGYMAGARIYDRALSNDECAILANEFSPEYAITVNDLSFSLYQKNETYGITYSSAMTPVTFEIIEGSLPNTISFNTNTGQFSGKGLTDADHTYNLKVRLTAPKSIPATCNVTIHTYMTARISLNNQTFNFISNKSENFEISYTSDEAVTFTIESGTMPAGMTLSSGRFYSNGQNTSADNQQVVVRATSAHNQTGVARTMTLNMQMNAIVMNAQTLKFYTGQGIYTKAVKYNGSLNSVSDAVFSMMGTLPAGVTWDATSGSFTSDGTQTTDETASVSVTISSANGTSTAATATMTLETHVGDPPMPIEDLLVHIPCDSYSSTTEEGLAIEYYNADSTSFTTHKGIQCFDTSAANRRMLVQGFNVDFNNQYTESIWICQSALAYTFSRGLCFGYDQPMQSLVIPNIYPNTLRLGAGGYSVDLSTNYYISLDTWYHIVQTFDNGICKIFVNGELVYTSTTQSINVRQAKMSVGIGTYSTSGDYFKGYLAGARLYNRVLDDSEIQALADEFTPTA